MNVQVYIYNKIFSPLGICLGIESYSSVIFRFWRGLFPLLLVEEANDEEEEMQETCCCTLPLLVHLELSFPPFPSIDASGLSERVQPGPRILQFPFSWWHFFPLMTSQGVVGRQQMPALETDKRQHTTASVSLRLTLSLIINISPVQMAPVLEGNKDQTSLK